jgi:hypothetical protein
MEKIMSKDLFAPAPTLENLARAALAAREVKAQRRNKARRDRDQAMRDLGLKRVRGALGGVYWE